MRSPRPPSRRRRPRAMHSRPAVAPLSSGRRDVRRPNRRQYARVGRIVRPPAHRQPAPPANRDTTRRAITSESEAVTNARHTTASPRTRPPSLPLPTHDPVNLSSAPHDPKPSVPATFPATSDNQARHIVGGALRGRAGSLGSPVRGARSAGRRPDLDGPRARATIPPRPGREANRACGRSDLGGTQTATDAVWVARRLGQAQRSPKPSGGRGARVTIAMILPWTSRSTPSESSSS